MMDLKHTKTIAKFILHSIFVKVVILNVKYVNGFICSEVRCMDGVGFEISGRTSVPK